MLSRFTHQFFQGTWQMKDIPAEYYSQKEGVKLMASGKIHQANEGCSCAMGAVMEQFVKNLRLTKNQFALLGMEAGVEHFGRGIDNSVDLVLMVVDPSYESLQLTGKIGGLADSIGKPFYYILNKVTEKNASLMRENIRHPERIIACMEADEGILDKGLTGQELQEKPAAVEELTGVLLSFAEKGNENAETI